MRYVPVLILGTACASGGLRRVDEASLLSAGAEQQAAISRRAAAHEDARAALRDAQAVLAKAKLDLEESRYRRDRVDDRLDARRDLRGQASELSLEAKVRDLEAEITALQIQLDVERRSVQLAKAQVDYARQEVRLREAELMLADAEWEGAKASAVKEAAPDGSTAIKLSDFKGQVAQAHEKVAGAQQSSARAWKTVEDRRRKHEMATAKLPTSSETERSLAIAQRNEAQLTQKVGRLEKRIRDLERENAQLMTRLTKTSTAS